MISMAYNFFSGVICMRDFTFIVNFDIWKGAVMSSAQIICLNSAANFSAGLCRGHSLSRPMRPEPLALRVLGLWHGVPRVWSPWHFPFVSIRWAYMNVLETIPFSGDWKALLPCPEIADEVVDSSLLCRCAVHCGTRHFQFPVLSVTLHILPFKG